MNLARAVFAVVPVAVAAGFGGLGARRAPAVYARLHKPIWAPPAQVFGPVWSVLYAGNAVAGWRLYTRAPKAIRGLHLAQLALNTAWPVVFFAGHRKALALAIVGALDGLVAAELVAAAKTDPTAAVLLAPYLGWTGFATVLNATVLNAAVSEPGV